MVPQSGWLETFSGLLVQLYQASLYLSRRRRTVALKVFTNDLQNRGEIDIYKHLMSIKSDHPGGRYLRNALDTFTLHGPKGQHQCLVHEPMWESMRELLWRNESRRFTEPLLKALLLCLFQALDYLHTEAHLIHTGESSLYRHHANGYSWSCRYKR